MVVYDVVISTTKHGIVHLITDLTNYSVPARIEKAESLHTSVTDLLSSEDKIGYPAENLYDALDLGEECKLDIDHEKVKIESCSIYKCELLIRYWSTFNGDTTEYDSDTIIRNPILLDYRKLMKNFKEY
jgi:hypothetical protein